MTGSNHYAAIYVRVSSEAQAEKASPDEQERDCRAVAAQHGLTVIRVYADTKKYRVKSKLVEPSGTRDDRPGLLAMLADAAAGQFGTLIAWKEDRLYRSPKACVKVLGVVENSRLTVLLARENFDQKFAHLKAWVAGMELDAIKERMAMGKKARLRAGKANTGFDRYGYKRAGEKIIIVEEEARWVRQIFAWYIEHISLSEIQARLIAAGAQQKGGTKPRRGDWSISAIQNILRNARAYASHVKTQSVSGEEFEIPIEPIIDAVTYQRAVETRANNRDFKADNIRVDYLLAGLVYSDCGKWSGNRAGGRVGANGQRQYYPNYRCNRLSAGAAHEDDCPKTAMVNKTDDLAWSKFIQALDNPDLLIAGAQAYIDELQAKAARVLAEQDQLQREIDDIIIQRQWVITQARTGKITQADMDHQLTALVMQEISTRARLADSQRIIEIAFAGQWEQEARGFLADVKAGIAAINLVPETEDERREAFELKRFAVRQLVERVTIHRDRDLSVTIKLDVPTLIEQAQAKYQGICGPTTIAV